MIEDYDHKKVEKKWREKWEKENLFQNTADKITKKPKKYILSAFPYPSGEGLHVGHMEPYTALDILARYYRMAGEEVFFPVGWDSFGLPAENYAVKTGIHPRVTTMKAIANFSEQLRKNGISKDWSTEVTTSNPDYYKWTQWLFLEFYKKDVAYKGKANVNWCPSCQTVLANEQVVNGECERCGAEVVQKEMEQWFFRITDYKDQLIEDLNKVDWPSYTKLAQHNWIGRSEGAEIEFDIEGFNEKIKVFTTRPDTVFGATYLVLAPEHNLVSKITNKENELVVKKYVDETLKKNQLERQKLERNKTGVFTGSYAINPFSKERIPIWIADYVVVTYGTGAIMAVPAHDARDFEFANKYNIKKRLVLRPHNEFQSLVIKESVEEGFADEVIKEHMWVFNYDDWGLRISGNIPELLDKYIDIVQKHLKAGKWYDDVDGGKRLVIFKNKVFNIETENEQAKQYARELGIPDEQIDWQSEANYNYLFERSGNLVNSGKYDGLSSYSVLERLENDFPEVITSKVTYKLRDWLISRQRYWGAPIPIVYDPEGHPHAVKEEHLPWLLPDDVDFNPHGESPLKSSKEFKERVERLYGKGWTPEYDTMDTFVDSSWYYLRYVDAKNVTEFANKEKIEKLLPVDFYMIGPEHTVLHLLYARFFTKFLRDQGYLNFDEPFMKMRHQGMILGPNNAKMSKSKGNIIVPDDVIDKYGSDTLRTYEMFMGPIDADKPWDTNGAIGVRKFLARIYRLTNFSDFPEVSSVELSSKLNKTIKKVGSDIENLKYNTAIASMMEFVNLWEKNKNGLSREDTLKFVKILAPFAPFISEEIYQALVGFSDDSLEKVNKNVSKNSSLGAEEFNSVHVQSWPEYNKSLAKEETTTIVIQVNGKVRGTLENVSVNASEDEIKQMALENASKYLTNVEIKKMIYIPQKLISFVV